VTFTLPTTHTTATNTIVGWIPWSIFLPPSLSLSRITRSTCRSGSCPLELLLKPSPRNIDSLPSSNSHYCQLSPRAEHIRLSNRPVYQQADPNGLHTASTEHVFLYTKRLIRSLEDLVPNLSSNSFSSAYAPVSSPTAYISVSYGWFASSQLSS
jgi:hypothetical protein